MFEINYLGVVLAALAGFVVGGLWYGPIMGKRWMGAMGFTEEDVQEGNYKLIFGGAFLFSLLASWTLAHTFATFDYWGDPVSFTGKVLTAVGVAFGFIIPAIGTNYLFQRSNKALFFIDASYWLLFYTAMGFVHAFLP